MGKNDSALPKGGERRAGGTPAPAAAGLWERLPGPGSAAQLAAGSGVCHRGRQPGPDGEGEPNQRGSGGEVTCHLLETSFTP